MLGIPICFNFRFLFSFFRCQFWSLCIFAPRSGFPKRLFSQHTGDGKVSFTKKKEPTRAETTISINHRKHEHSKQAKMIDAANGRVTWDGNFRLFFVEIPQKKKRAAVEVTVKIYGCVACELSGDEFKWHFDFHVLRVMRPWLMRRDVSGNCLKQLMAQRAFEILSDYITLTKRASSCNLLMSSAWLSMFPTSIYNLTSKPICRHCLHRGDTIDISFQIYADCDNRWKRLFFRFQSFQVEVCATDTKQVCALGRSTEKKRSRAER